MSKERNMLSVWFFIGVLLTIYGAVILIASISNWSSPSTAALAKYHSGVWEGILLLLIGAFYVLRFRPRPKHKKYD